MFPDIAGAADGCQDGGMAQVRPYRGVEAPDRVAERRRRFSRRASTCSVRRPRPAELTVRAICAAGRRLARYFYESFTDKDDFVAAVFDWVIADIAATTQAAVAAAPAAEQSRAGIANLVRTIADDTRIGRLLFNPRCPTPWWRASAPNRRLLRDPVGSARGALAAQRRRPPSRRRRTFVVGGVARRSAHGWPATSTSTATSWSISWRG